MHIRITYKNVIIYSCPFLVLDMVLILLCSFHITTLELKLDKNTKHSFFSLAI